MNSKYNEKLKDTNHLEKLYDLYDKNDNLKEKNAFNVFNILNLRENSHTSLIKWLLSNCDKFRQLFSELLQVEIEGISFNENTNFKHNGKNNYMDCIFTFKNSNKDCVCVIESKLDAKLCIIDGETQIERYCNHLLDTYKDKEKHFVYLCASVDRDSMNKQVKINGENKGRLKTSKILELTKNIYDKKINFHKIEFSDIILILFDILYNNESENRIRCTNKDVKELINSLSDKPIIKGFMDNFRTEENVNYTMENLRKNNYKKPQRYNINLEKFLNNEIVDKNKLLSQYIEYWEDWAPFIDGYTKIINGIFLYNIKEIIEK